MATTVQTSVTDNQATSPFFYLRITGLPYYIFCTIKPSDTRYGSFAWATPTDYPATWAQQGLQLPSEAIDQKFPDIIGGVATPGRTKLSVMDFPDPAHVGYKFFSRLFAPGRALSDSSIAKALLANPVSPVPGVDTVIEVNGQTGTWTVPSDVYVGAETIGIDLDTPGGTGEHELQIAKRNKYVCFGNTADSPDDAWPPIPFHRVDYDESGNVKVSPQVTAEAVDILGRTAALWMGHMRPDGNPEPETSSTCLLLGRIVDIGIGKIGGMFDMTIESITADLTKGRIAPDLGHATIQDGFYLENSAWCTFYLGFVSGTGAVTVTPGIYSTQSLINAINVQLATLAGGTVTLKQIQNGDGDTVFAFESSTPSFPNILVSSLPQRSLTATSAPAKTSLHYALGFDPTVPYVQAQVDNATSTVGPILIATRPAARVFVPTYDQPNSNNLNLVEPNAADRFFQDQNDGSNLAWARFGDGSLALVRGSSSGSNTVTTGQHGAFAENINGESDEPGFGQFYYCERGDTPTIDQVLYFITTASGQGNAAYTEYLGRLLASSKSYTSSSAGLNIFPQYVGMGWFPLLTESNWTVNDESSILRLFYVDNTTTWIELFKPYAREHGLFLAWDPSANGISLRRIRIPSATAAGTNVSFTESNRARESDRTSQRVDRTNLRTSWKLQPRFSFSTFKPGSITLVDAQARSMYPNDDRQEELTDPTLVATGMFATLLNPLVSLYSTPWTLCQRSMNKRGMLLAPGTVHQVVDNTMVNPFTGAAGITSADAVYCFLTRVAVTPAEGAVSIEFVINSTDDQSLYRQWSPTALVDFTLNGGGYTRGYNSAAKSLVTTMTYGTNSDGDAGYFAVGDTIRVINRDSSDGTSASQTDTIAAIGGGTITVTTGLSALSATSETIIVLQKYNSATTTRKTGATKVAWQGDGDTRVIQGSSTARLNRWS